jgi:hypothetical protein
MARGYGIGNFGDAYFGVTKYVDVSAASSVSSGFDAVAYKTVATNTEVASQSVVTSAAVVTYSGIGLIYADSVVTASGTRVREVSGVSASSVSGSCNTAIVNNLSITIPAVVSTSTSYERVRESDVTITSTATSSITAFYKYEPVAKENETWNDVSASGGTWNDVSASGGTWTEVA